MYRVERNNPVKPISFQAIQKRVPHFSKTPFGHGGLPWSAGGTRRFSGLLQPWTSTRRLGGCWTQSRGTNGRAVTATWWCEAVSGFGDGRDPGGHAWVFCFGAEIGDFSRRMKSRKSVSKKLRYLTFWSKPIHKVLRILNPKTKSWCCNRSASFQHC